MHEGCHIMLVEDDFAIRETVADVLEGEGFEVTCAANGAEALRRLGDGSAQPGLILLDLMMPVMDGAAFARALRAEASTAGIPVVAISADGSPERVAAVAPRAFLPKPFDIEALLEAVRAALPPGERAADPRA